MIIFSIKSTYIEDEQGLWKLKIKQIHVNEIKTIACIIKTHLKHKLNTSEGWIINWESILWIPMNLRYHELGWIICIHRSNMSYCDYNQQNHISLNQLYFNHASQHLWDDMIPDIANEWQTNLGFWSPCSVHWPFCLHDIWRDFLWSGYRRLR